MSQAKARVQLSDHFSYGKLLRFVFPSVMMLFFTAIYGVVEGLCVSNFAGKTAFAAINFIIPITCVLGVFGYMFGSGTSALIAKALGEQKKEKANQLFSAIYLIAIFVGIILSVAGQFILPIAARMLGAEGELLTEGIKFARITLMFIPALILQYVNQYMFPTTGKPKVGMAFTIISGVTNIGLILVLVVVFRVGVAGAAFANGIGQCLGGIVPIIYFFSKKNDGLLHFTKPKMSLKELGRVGVNGSSEFISNLSVYLIGILYNYQLMRFIGEDGVAIFGVIMYVNMLFVSVFNGYAIGISPSVGYQNGAKHYNELKNLLKKSLIIVAILGVALLGVAIIATKPLAYIYVGYDKQLFDMTTVAFRLYATSFLIMGFNIFGSAFFTALNNGAVSALIAFLRTLLFQSFAVMILPILIGENGIWLSVFVAEILSAIVTIICLIINRKKYHYL